MKIVGWKLSNNRQEPLDLTPPAAKINSEAPRRLEAFLDSSIRLQPGADGRNCE